MQSDGGEGPPGSGFFRRKTAAERGFFLDKNPLRGYYNKRVFFPGTGKRDYQMFQNGGFDHEI